MLGLEPNWKEDIFDKYKKKKEFNEIEFQKVYKEMATKQGLNLDPDDPKHYYDYRALYKETGRLEPDETGHFPSKYKLEGHPRMIIDEVNTKTGMKEPDIFDKYKTKLSLEKAKDVEIGTEPTQFGIGAKAETGVTLPKPEVPSYWGISDVTKPMDLSKLPETGKKIVQMLGGQIGLKLTEPETYKQIDDISKEINKQPDKLSRIAKAHELLTGESIKQSLEEMGKPTLQPWEKSGFTYQPGLGEITDIKLPEKFNQAQALAQQAIQFSTSGKIGDVMQTVARDVVLAYLVGYGLKTVYQSGMKIEETWVSGKKLEAAVKRAQKAYIPETNKFKTTLSDNDFRIIKQLQGIVRTTGVKAGEITGVKVPQRVFLGQAGEITNLVKIIQNAGKITPEVTEQLKALSPPAVTQVAAQLAPALASEFLKAIEKPEVPKELEPEAEERAIKTYGTVEKLAPYQGSYILENGKLLDLDDAGHRELGINDFGRETGGLRLRVTPGEVNVDFIDSRKPTRVQIDKIEDLLITEQGIEKNLLWEIVDKEDKHVIGTTESGEINAFQKMKAKLNNFYQAIAKPELITEKVEEPIEVEPPPKEPWEPLTLPPPAEVPKIEPEFKEPKIHTYYMPKDQLMREIGAEPLTRPLMLKKEALMLKIPEVKKWLKDVIGEIKTKATFAEKLKAGIFNKPTEEVARFRDLLNTYVEKLPDTFSAKAKDIFDKLRSFTKGMLNDANKMRVRAGLKPIPDFGAYVPHFLDELARKVHYDEQTRIKVEGIVGKKLYRGPKGGNPTAIQRKIGAELDHIFSKDLEKLLMSMAIYDLRDIYLAEPYAIYRAQMDEFIKEGVMSQEVKTEIENFVSYDIFDKQAALDKFINTTLGPGTDIVNFFLKPFNRVITDPVRIASSIYRFGVMGGAIAGKVRMLTRNLLQRSLNMCIYGPQALIKGQFVAPKDVMEKIRNLDVYKLSVRKFEDVPAAIPWILKPVAKAVQAGLVPYAKTHAGLTYFSNVDVSARTAYFWGLKKIEWQKSEGAMEYTKAYAKKFGIKEGTPRYERLFWREGDELAEAEEGIGSTQWFYFPTRMPRPYRGQAARAFWSLNSWWMNYWGRHWREMMSRCRGVTGRGRILTRWERLNAIKGLAIILGIGEAVRRKYKLRTSEFLAFVFPVYIYPHLYQVMINTYDALTATVQSERDKAQQKLKYNLKMLAPFSGAYREYVKFISGEITLKEYLFYVEKVSKGEISPPSKAFDKYGPTKTTEEDMFEKYRKETKGEDIFDKYKR